jgi:arylsulfatase A-like enzyme
MRYLRFLIALFTLVTLLHFSLPRSAAADRPNIIFIMADDLGYTDVGCYGSGFYETPHIDHLASQGLRLLNHHHCQNCAPTRAALMSGQYAPRTGVYTVGSIDRFNWRSQTLRPVDNVTQLPLDRDIIAKQLRAAGYRTGMFGKWHLGEQGDYHPARRGFDEAIVSAGVHFNFETNPMSDYPQGEYLADFLTDKAVDFIERHQSEPFFLYLSHFGVHSPYEAKEQLIAKYRDKPAVGGHRNPVYAAMIQSVDESVGRVMQTLDKLQLTDNTVLIFTSDNGGVGGYEREGIRAEGSDVTDNAPLRSGKGSLYEGGTRVPFVIRWPTVITPGAENNTPTIHVDIYPTLLEIASASPPLHQLDGVSLAPLLRSSEATLQRTAIFQHFPGYLGAGKNMFRTKPVSLIQVGNWKLMEFHEDQHLELYDLDNDIGETKNLVDTYPEKAAALHQQLLAWRKQIAAPMPTPNEPSINATNTGERPQKSLQNRKKKPAQEGSVTRDTSGF